MNKEHEYKITERIDLDDATLIGSDRGYYNDFFYFSDIATKLIKKAAECERFSSDIVIDLMYLKDKINNKRVTNEIMWFGFRENGIDGKEVINTEVRLDDYFAMYALKINVTEDEKYISMNLFDVPEHLYKQQKVKSFIRITETLCRTVCIEHTPDESPEDIVEELRNQEKIVLDADDFVDYDLEDVTSDVDPADQKYYQFFPME